MVVPVSICQAVLTYVRQLCLHLQGDNSTSAHPSNFTMKHTLEEPNTTYTYTLCPSQISEVSVAGMSLHQPCSDRDLANGSTACTISMWAKYIGGS